MDNPFDGCVLSGFQNDAFNDAAGQIQPCADFSGEQTGERDIVKFKSSCLPGSRYFRFFDDIACGILP